MTKQTIEIEDLPEGWKLTRIKLPPSDKLEINSRTISCHNLTGALFDLEKIKPREIRLVETNEYRQPMQWEYAEIRDDVFAMQGEEMVIGGPYKIWRNKVKETAIPLNSEEPKLSLSVSECEDLQVMRDMDLTLKICNFIKENS
jgi:hypothetical protein